MEAATVLPVKQVATAQTKIDGKNNEMHGKISSMPSLYESLNAALQDHWKAHDKKYPTFVLSPEDRDGLMQQISIVREVFGPSAQNFEREKFHGALIQVRQGAAPSIISADGSERPLVL